MLVQLNWEVVNRHGQKESYIAWCTHHNLNQNELFETLSLGSESILITAYSSTGQVYTLYTGHVKIYTLSENLKEWS